MDRSATSIATVDAPSASGVQPAAVNRSAMAGVGLGLIAHAVWGSTPVYFKAVQHVSVWELLAHRVVWAAPMLLVVVLGFRRVNALRAALADRSVRRTLALTTCLIAVNWFLYMYAIVTDRVLHASMGYFYGPLVNIVLARVFLGERMSPATKFAVGLAACSVGLMTWDMGALPWITVVLPVSFGFYALLRKKAPVDPLSGLTVEAWALLPVASAYLVWAHTSGSESDGVFGGDLTTSLLMPVAGLVTVIPLLTYNASAKRLTLTAVGFMQYLAPTGQLLLGWLVYDEEMSPVRAAAFVVVWIGLCVYTADQVRRARRRARWTAQPET